MAGNDALPLIAAGGDPADDAVRGRMAPTPVLAQLPYTRQIFAALGAPIGRSRFMRIEQEGEVTPHVDLAHYWWDHVRVHVPVLTDPSVEFQIGDDVEHMAAGEVWAIDTWKLHSVRNPAVAPAHPPRHRHRGLGAFWQLLDRSTRPRPTAASPSPRTSRTGSGADLTFPIEARQPAGGDEPVEVERTLDALARRPPLVGPGRRPTRSLPPSPTCAGDLAGARGRRTATGRTGWRLRSGSAPRPASGCSGSRAATRLEHHRRRQRGPVAGAGAGHRPRAGQGPQRAAQGRRSPASPGGSSSR